MAMGAQEAFRRHGNVDNQVKLIKIDLIVTYLKIGRTDLLRQTLVVSYHPRKVGSYRNWTCLWGL